MNFKKDSILFDEEERWITGLPERLPIEAVGVAFGMTRRARTQSYKRFYELLTCDVEVLSDEQAASLHLFPDRLRRLDQLSEWFIPILMPRIISEFEQAQQLDEEVAGVVG